MIIRKIFRTERDIFNFHCFSVQIVQRTGICSKCERQLIGVKSLLFFTIAAVDFAAAVFSISQQRVASGGKLRSDLVCAACHQLAFHQTQRAAAQQCFIMGYGCCGARRGDAAHKNLLFRFILKQLPAQCPLCRRRAA